MIDLTRLAEIKRRDESYKDIPAHWQAQVDRRYLLEVIAELSEEIDYE